MLLTDNNINLIVFLLLNAQSKTTLVYVKMSERVCNEFI